MRNRGLSVISDGRLKQSRGEAACLLIQEASKLNREAAVARWMDRALADIRADQLPAMSLRLNHWLYVHRGRNDRREPAALFLRECGKYVTGRGSLNAALNAAEKAYGVDFVIRVEPLVMQLRAAPGLSGDWVAPLRQLMPFVDPYAYLDEPEPGDEGTHGDASEKPMDATDTKEDRGATTAGDAEPGSSGTPAAENGDSGATGVAPTSLSPATTPLTEAGRRVFSLVATLVSEAKAGGPEMEEHIQDAHRFVKGAFAVLSVAAAERGVTVEDLLDDALQATAGALGELRESGDTPAMPLPADLLGKHWVGDNGSRARATGILADEAAQATAHGEPRRHLFQGITVRSDARAGPLGGVTSADVSTHADGVVRNTGPKVAHGPAIPTVVPPDADGEDLAKCEGCGAMVAAGSFDDQDRFLCTKCTEGGA